MLSSYIPSIGSKIVKRCSFSISIMPYPWATKSFRNLTLGIYVFSSITFSLKLPQCLTFERIGIIPPSSTGPHIPNTATTT